MGVWAGALHDKVSIKVEKQNGSSMKIPKIKIFIMYQPSMKKDNFSNWTELILCDGALDLLSMLLLAFREEVYILPKFS